MVLRQNCGGMVAEFGIPSIPMEHPRLKECHNLLCLEEVNMACMQLFHIL